MKINFSLTRNGLLVMIPVLALFFIGSYAGMEYYTSRSSFCGASCHTMAEPYASWKNDKHQASKNAKGIEASCINCHFLPGEKYGLKAKYEGLRHLFAYLYDKEAPIPIRPVVKDGACLSSGCHSDRKFEDKEIKYTEKVRFNHKVHLGDKALEGQKLACETCHIKVTKEKHFEVPKQICFLCHLKLEKPTLEKVETADARADVKRISFAGRPTINFNEGLSRCDICHTIPTKPLQSQAGEGSKLTRPITHQTIKKAGVACESCHFETVKGSGEINTGNVISDGCLSCHSQSKKLLAKAGDKKLMHDAHVAKRRADCFDCHRVIEHKRRTDHLDFVRQDCSLCHQDTHKFQKILLAGTPINENISRTPNLMFNVNTNCMGCHLKKTLSKGHAVRTGAPETCAACHTAEHKKMLQDWRKQVDREVKEVEEVEAEALQALEAAKDKVAAGKLKKAKAMIAEGQGYLDIVRFGNGVHNKKYSIMIMDEAITKFEETIELLDDGA